MRLFLAVLIGFNSVILAQYLSSDDNVKTPPDKALRALRETCERFKDPKDALMLIGEFRHRTKPQEPVSGQLALMEAEWKERLDKKLVRLGTKWVTVAEKAIADKESRQLVEEALALVRVNDFEGAREVLEKASNANKEDGLADYLLGLHYALNHSPEEGKRHFKKVLARSPANFGAMNNLAICELKSGNGAAALNHWTEAAQLAPNSPEIIHNLGRVVYEQGQKRLRIPKSNFDKYRKLYSSLASSADSQMTGPMAWMLTPAVAPAAVKPQENPGEKANLVGLGQGTGFFVDENFILTNRHVVESDTFGTADVVQVSVPSGPGKTAAVRAELVAVSPKHDLALLKCDNLNLPPLPLSSNVPPLGTEVMALGYPRTDVLGLTIKSTRGSISGISDLNDGVLFYDVAINPGNSGGPLLDKSGQVVSINTFFMNVDQEISGGVTSAEAIKFLQEKIPGFNVDPFNNAQKEWPEVAQTGSGSTVLVEVLFADAAPVLAAKAGAERMNGAYLLDNACLICRGTGRTACPNKSCFGGKVRVQYFEQKVVGFGNLQRVVDVPQFRHEDCPNCANNAIPCPDCGGSGRARR